MIFLATDYDYLIDGKTLKMACSYKKLAHTLNAGSRILCADGDLELRV